MAHDVRCAFARHTQCKCSCGGSQHGGGFSGSQIRRLWSKSTPRSRFIASVALIGRKSYAIVYADREVSGNVKVYSQVSADSSGLRTEAGLSLNGVRGGIEIEHLTGAKSLVIHHGKKEIRMPI